MHVHRASINILSSFDFFAFSIQLGNPRSYSNLENYYNKFRICKRKNNWLHSPQNILGVEDLPFLKVSVKCTLLHYPTLSNARRFYSSRGEPCALMVYWKFLLQITHPAGCFSQFLNFFGEKIFIIWKLILLRRRILFFSPPPVGISCYRGEPTFFICSLSR
jgi:hypothetical protein